MRPSELEIGSEPSSRAAPVVGEPVPPQPVQPAVGPETKDAAVIPEDQRRRDGRALRQRGATGMSRANLRRRRRRAREYGHGESSNDDPHTLDTAEALGEVPQPRRYCLRGDKRRALTQRNSIFVRVFIGAKAPSAAWQMTARASRQNPVNLLQLLSGPESATDQRANHPPRLVGLLLVGGDLGRALSGLLPGRPAPSRRRSATGS